jgi:serine O-acetyltransferase
MEIKRSATNIELAGYISRQINFHFPDQSLVEEKELLDLIIATEERAFNCFCNIRKKYFNEDGIVIFNHLHADQYAMYLYMLSRKAYEMNLREDIATKLYYLNKALHSVDLYYTLKLPDVFLFVHPLGSILGRAEYSDHFIMYQGCTVGCLNDGIFPTFKGKAVLYAHSQILGNCTIGDNVCIASGVTVVNTDVPDNTVVFGSYPKYKFAENKKDFFDRPPFKYGI